MTVGGLEVLKWQAVWSPHGEISFLAALAYKRLLAVLCFTNADADTVNHIFKTHTRMRNHPL